MKISKVCCQGCGADLNVDESVRYVTCNHCHARLEVVHDTSVTHTRLLEKLEQNTGRMAGNLRVIELQNDLERLDREWGLHKAKLGIPTDAAPTAGQETFANAVSVGMVMFGAVFTLIGVALTIAFPLFFFLPLFGAFWTSMAIYISVNNKKRLAAYRLAEVEFQTRREALLRRLDEARKAS